MQLLKVNVHLLTHFQDKTLVVIVEAGEETIVEKIQCKQDTDLAEEVQSTLVKIVKSMDLWLPSLVEYMGSTQ